MNNITEKKKRKKIHKFHNIDNLARQRNEEQKLKVKTNQTRTLWSGQICTLINDLNCQGIISPCSPVDPSAFASLKLQLKWYSHARRSILEFEFLRYH